MKALVYFRLAHWIWMCNTPHHYKQNDWMGGWVDERVEGGVNGSRLGLGGKAGLPFNRKVAFKVPEQDNKLHPNCS